jgi:hypothetical protein
MKFLAKQKGSTIAGILATLLFFVVLICGVVGYVKNILALFHAGPIATWAGMEIARIFGIIIPVIGAILGYF